MNYKRLEFTVCHRLPQRSFFWKGRQFPVCARCTGIHIGYLSLFLFLFNIIHIPFWWSVFNVGLSILSFCIPIAGAVIFSMNKDTMPQKAKTACYLALAGMAVGLVLNIVSGGLGALR